MNLYMVISKLCLENLLIFCCCCTVIKKVVLYGMSCFLYQAGFVLRCFTCSLLNLLRNLSKLCFCILVKCILLGCVYVMISCH